MKRGETEVLGRERKGSQQGPTVLGKENIMGERSIESGKKKQGEMMETRRVSN